MEPDRKVAARGNPCHAAGVRMLPVSRFLLGLALAISAKGEVLEFKEPAPAGALAFPIGNGRLGTLVAGKTGTEEMALLAGPKSTASDASKPGTGYSGQALGTVQLDWLDAKLEVTDYQRVLDLQDGTVATTFKRGGAGFTATTFVSEADDLLVIHLRANKPGFLGFSVKLRHGERLARIEDRRMLVLNGGGGNPFEARAWIYPMESEVSPGDGEITVRGEGEALILVAASSDPAVVPLLAGRMKEHGFGGPEHPDIFRLWHTLLDRHRSAHRKAMAGKPGDLASYLKLACGNHVVREN